MLTHQKKLFYEQPPKDSKKGQYNPTPVSQRRHARRSTHKQFKLRFTDRDFTQVAGYPMLERIYDTFHLRQSLQRRLRIGRKEDGFRASELSQFLVDQKMLGAKRLYEGDRLRSDPMLVTHYGIDDLPSDSTTGRYLREFDSKRVKKLSRLNTQIAQGALAVAEDQFQQTTGVDQDRSMEVTLDVDATRLSVYGKQENAKKGMNKRKKDTPQYTQVTTFVAGCEVLLDQQLFSGNENLAGKMQSCEKRAQHRLPSEMNISGIRVDAAGYSDENVKRWEEAGYTYGASAMCTNHLQEEIRELTEQDFVQFIRKKQEDGEEQIIKKTGQNKQESFAENEELVAEIAEITYKPSTWDHGPYTYIISRRKEGKEGPEQDEKPVDYDFTYSYYAYITNHQGGLLEKFQFVVGRSNVERGIKESKIGFDGEYVPVDDYQGNRAYLGHVQIAYNLLQAMKMSMLPPSLCRRNISRLNREIFHVPGELIPDGEDWIIEVPKWWPYKQELEAAWESVMPPPCQN